MVKTFIRVLLLSFVFLGGGKFHWHGQHFAGLDASLSLLSSRNNLGLTGTASSCCQTSVFAKERPSVSQYLSRVRRQAFPRSNQERRARIGWRGEWKELKLLWAFIVFSLKCLLGGPPTASRSCNCLGCLPLWLASSPRTFIRLYSCRRFTFRCLVPSLLATLRLDSEFAGGLRINLPCDR